MTTTRKDLLEKSNIKSNRRTAKTLSIDSDTSDKLDVLKERLQSPRAWIIRRLVEQELKRVR